MSISLEEILTLTVLLPAIAGLIRIRQISPVYLPFLLVIWVGLINEIFSLIIISMGYYNIYNYNLHVLLETFLILWQFKNLKLFESKNAYRIIGLSLLVVYLADNLFFFGFHYFNSYFFIFRSVVIAFMSIHMINKLLITERENLLKHPVFLFCAAFVLFFTVSIITEVFWVYGKFLSKNFRLGMQFIFDWSNGTCNIVYLFAILWMPRRQAFTLPY
jgi:hypothetical protein